MERGQQVKGDVRRRAGENSDFPNLCEGCLGENPYVRMQKITFGGTCKMCERPYTMFKWRPGRGEGYNMTEVCQTCSRLKNICQTCILDLQFGLPSQLRDAVLATAKEAISVPVSDVNQEYQNQRQIALLEAGKDPWAGKLTPNDQLLEIARLAKEQREPSRVKIHTLNKKRAHDIAFQDQLISMYADEELEESNDLPLPPGIESVDQLQNTEKSIEKVINKEENTINDVKLDSKVDSKNDKSIVRPPKPAGPPPPWAFKTNKIQSATIIS